MGRASWFEFNMNEAFICDAIRTPIGRYGGALSSVRTDDLAAIPISELMNRNTNVDWEKIDIGTFSWQKCVGGEGGHGMIILAQRAVDRINTFIPSWPIPKLLNLRKEKKINLDIFKDTFV